MGRVVEEHGVSVHVWLVDEEREETHRQTDEHLLVGDVVTTDGAAVHLAPRRTLLQRAAAGDQAHPDRDRLTFC